jgi:hypothetical protein
MDTGMTSFLREAIRQEKPIDLSMASGHTFRSVLATGLLLDTVELEKLEDRVVRRWVVVIDRIEWGVLSA